MTAEIVIAAWFAGWAIYVVVYAFEIRRKMKALVWYYEKIQRVRDLTLHVRLVANA